MSKLIVVALEESESSIFDKILEIVNQTKKCEVETIDGQQQVIQIGDLVLLPDQHKVLKENHEVNLTNIEFRILYVLALHQGMTLSKEKIYNYVWDGCWTAN